MVYSLGVEFLTAEGSWNPRPRIVKVWAEGDVFKVMMEGKLSPMTGPSAYSTYGPLKSVQVTVEVSFTPEGLRWVTPYPNFWLEDQAQGGVWRHPRRIGKFAHAMGYPNPECLFKSFKDDPRPIYLASYLPPPTLWEHLDDNAYEGEWRVCPDPE